MTRATGPRVILTGGRSFAARAIGPALLNAGAEVWAVVRALPLTVPWSGAGTGTLHVEAGNLSDPVTWRTLPRDVDAIVHLASRIESPATPASVFLRDTVETTRALIAHAQAGRVGRIIYFSSVSVHGRVPGPVLDHDTGFHDPTVYGLSKRLAELLLADVADAVPSVSLRLPGIVGPGAHGNWLSRCRDALRAGNPVTANNPGFAFNNTVHIDDLAGFVTDLCQRQLVGALAVPIGAGTPMRVDEMLEAMKSRTGSSSPLTFTEAASLPFSISTVRAEADLGYRPAPVADIIERFATEP